MQDKSEAGGAAIWYFHYKVYQINPNIETLTVIVMISEWRVVSYVENNQVNTNYWIPKADLPLYFGFVSHADAADNLAII